MKNEDEFSYKSIRKGDIKAFEKFYKKYQPRLFAYGYSILNDDETAKDLVQESFISFWENKEHIVTDYSVTAYLFKIFHSKCIKYLRSREIQNNFSNLSDLKMKEIELTYFHPDKNILGSIFMHEIEALYANAIAKLPEQCREIFILSKQKEIKSAEIAAKLGISVRTVENQIYKAIRIMRQEMKDYALPAIFFVTILTELF